MQHPASAAPGDVSETDAWARDALALLTTLPGVQRVGLALSEGGGRRHRFTASDRGGGGALDWCHVDAYEDVPLNTAVAGGEPVLGGLEDLEHRYPGFVGHQVGTAFVAVAAVPVHAAGQALGGYVLYFTDPQPFDEEQRAELQALGVRLGAELRRAQGSQERRSTSLAREPVPEGARVAVHEVPPGLEAAAGARRFLRSTLSGWDVDEETADTAVLCLSELVTNALIHTRAGAEVRALLDDGVLTTTVRDGGAGAVLEGPDNDPLRVHGRGLQVVAALARRWGSSLDSVGTTVWFVLEP